MAKLGCSVEILITVIIALALGKSIAQLSTTSEQNHLRGTAVKSTNKVGSNEFANTRWDAQSRDPGETDSRNHVNDGTRSTRRNRWVAGQSNCSCGRELSSLKRDLREEMRQRIALKTELDGFLSHLEEISETMKALNITLHETEKTVKHRQPVTFSAKLSYNRELKPLDTIVFDTVISNVEGGYDADTGKFTAPTDGTYLFHSTILSGYNTKVETAIIMNDKEVARIYSGAHDAHGSGSNTVALSLERGDLVWVRLLYQGGNHVHGYYSTFTGTLLS